MPSVPMPIPSVTVGVPKTCGIAPASLIAAAARSTRGWMPALHGFIVLWPLATPTIGFSKSPSPNPTARNIARFGERATPCVMSFERRLYDMAELRGQKRGEGTAGEANRSRRLRIIGRRNSSRPMPRTS
jgi:hypothetical protein